MLAHLPNLQEFSWMMSRYERDLSAIAPFGSFTGFKNLKKLQLDYNLCFPVMVGETFTQQLPDDADVRD
jgi:hypothetical protein